MSGGCVARRRPIKKSTPGLTPEQVEHFRQTYPLTFHFSPAMLDEQFLLDLAETFANLWAQGYSQVTDSNGEPRSEP